MSHEVGPSSFDIGVVTVAPAILIPSNPRRRGLMISCGVVNRVTISPRSGVTDTNGIVIAPNTPPLVLCCCDVGNWLQHDLWAVTNAGQENIAYSEVSELWQES